MQILRIPGIENEMVVSLREVLAPFYDDGVRPVCLTMLSMFLYGRRILIPET